MIKKINEGKDVYPELYADHSLVVASLINWLELNIIRKSPTKYVDYYRSSWMMPAHLHKDEESQI